MTQTVSLSDEAYDALMGLRRPGDSLSRVVLSLAIRERRRRIAALLGSWKMTAREEAAFIRGLYERRRSRIRPKGP